MIASAAARAHHRSDEKHSREEAYRRSQLVLGGEGNGDALPAEEELYTPLAPHYLLVPLKDCDYEVQDGQVSRK